MSVLGRLGVGSGARVLGLAMALVWGGAGLAQTQALPDQSVQGVPLTGAAGITESMDEISARAQAADLQPRELLVRPEFPNTRRPVANPAAPAISRWPEASPAEPGVGEGSPSRAPQTIGLSFTGATLADTGSFPPDTMGAVGPTQFIVAVNGRLRSFNKTTGAADGALNSTMDAFFASVMTPVSPPVVLTFTSDPRVRYDRLSGRWFILIIDVPCTNATCTSTAANRVLVAVSSGPTITNASNFTFFQFQISGSNFADYPTLGIDNQALYIGANMFSAAGSFTGTDAAVVRKSSILGAGPIILTTFSGLVPGSTGAGPFTPQGVDNYDPAATEGYFIGVDNATFSTLMVRRVSNPGATPTLSGNIALTVPMTTFPNPVTHLGNTGGNNGRLDALDDRLYAAHIRNGRLWTAHNFRVSSAGVASTAAGARNASRWYEIGNLSTTPMLIQSGTVFDSTTALADAQQYWIPSVMVSGQGHAALGFSAAGTNFRIDGATVGRLANDTLGATQGTPVRYTSSSTAYNPPSDPGGSGGRRWGDYSFTSLDPLDDMTMWTIQQFCDATNSYGVRAVKLMAPPPTLAACGSPTELPTGVATNVVLSGTGIYDPPATLANRIALSANVSGSGITVNSVTFNSPTSATVNLTAGPGATTGPVTITLVNPDGQTASNANCATVPVPTATATVSIDDVSLVEGDSGTTDAVFTVTRSNNSTAFSVGYATANDTALAPSDYVSILGTLTFAAGAGQPLSQTISVPVEGDLRVELDESFRLNLGPPSNVSGTTTLGDAQGVGTITNDDSAVVRFNPVAVSESEANTPMAFTVTLSRPVQSGVSLDVDSAFGTATAADFTPISSGSVSFPANANSAQTVNVTLNNDALIEGDEQFTLTLSNLVATGSVTLTNATATGTILDDDKAQTTTTTISNVAPATSVTGQSYTVSVNLAGQSSSPTGTITVSDGAVSCGPVALVAGSSPNSTASCALASTSAGAKTLTASYVPADGSFVASSGTTSHQVNPAATALSVSGPARSRINQPVSFSFALSVTAPGAGTPAGTVTLSSGAASCMVSVPTATPSCALSLPTLGTQTVSASFVPGHGDFLGSSASGANAATTLVFALSDLAISKSDAVSAYQPGDLLVYTIQLDNSGPDGAANFRILDTVPAELINVGWTCAASGGVSCPQASGTGDLNETVANMAAGATLVYALSGNVAGTPGQISNTASLELPTDTTIEDPVITNNSATDIDQIDFLFMNGFETGTVTTGSGSLQIPVQGLLSEIDVVARGVYALEDAQGMALQVYLRVFDGLPEVALAQRGSDGLLRLAPWRRVTTDPVLSWRASETVDGWVLDAAALSH